MAAPYAVCCEVGGIRDENKMVKKKKEAIQRWLITIVSITGSILLEYNFSPNYSVSGVGFPRKYHT